MDALANFAYSTVATAPSPATTGTTLAVATGQGSRFPTVPFNVVIWPLGQIPIPSNAEIARVTLIAGDTLTITRAQESTSARAVVIGDQIAAAITAKTLTDITAAADTLHVQRNLTVSGDHAAQIDAFVESGSGGAFTGAQINGRTSVASTWDPSGGQIFGLGVEANLRRPSTSEASVIAANIQAKLLAGATGFGEVTATELDVISEEIPTFRVGIQISAVPSSELPTTEGKQSSGLDAMILMENKNYGARWKNAIYIFDNGTSRFPIDTTGAILDVVPSAARTIAKGIDLSNANLTISGNAFASLGFAVSGSGNITITGNGPTLTLTDNAGSPTKSYTFRSDDGEWILRDATAGADRVKIDTNGSLLILTSNMGIGASAFGTSAVKVLGIATGTAPTTSPIDMIQLFSVDAAAGEATLGLRTEASVVTESLTSDRTLKVVINGTVYKFCLKS